MDRKSTLIAAGALAGTLAAGAATVALTGDALRDHGGRRRGPVDQAQMPGGQLPGGPMRGGPMRGGQATQGGWGQAQDGLPGDQLRSGDALAGSLGLPDANGNIADPQQGQVQGQIQGQVPMPNARAAQQAPVGRSSASGMAGPGGGNGGQVGRAPSNRSWGDDGGYEHEGREQDGWGEHDD